MSGDIRGNEDNSNTYHLKLQGKDQDKWSI